MFLVLIRSRRLPPFPNLSSDLSLLSFALSVELERANPPLMESSLFPSASISGPVDLLVLPGAERSFVALPVCFLLSLVRFRSLHLPPLPELPTETSLLSIALSDELARVVVEGGFVCCLIVSVRLAVLADASASFWAASNLRLQTSALSSSCTARCLCPSARLTSAASFLAALACDLAAAAACLVAAIEAR